MLWPIMQNNRKVDEMETKENNPLQLESLIVECLKNIYDPEIPVNIYELGLIYEINIDDDQLVHLTMTLTAPNCPMADQLLEEVNQKVRGIEGVKELDLKLTFDPPWDKSMLSEEAALALGLL
jgi:FeS assembly SUF system protein